MDGLQVISESAHVSLDPESGILVVSYTDDDGQPVTLTVQAATIAVDQSIEVTGVAE